MKKILYLLSLLIVAMFLVGCAEELSEEEIIAEEEALLADDFDSEDDGAIAGQAIATSNCNFKSGVISCQQNPDGLITYVSEKTLNNKATVSYQCVINEDKYKYCLISTGSIGASSTGKCFTKNVMACRTVSVNSIAITVEYTTKDMCQAATSTKPAIYFDYTCEGDRIQQCAGNCDADGCNAEKTLCASDILGCTDPTATNYDAAATKDDGSCALSEICGDNLDNNGNGLVDCADPVCAADLSICVTEVPGCTNSTATNYDAAATKDDGSCVYPVANFCYYIDLNGNQKPAGWKWSQFSWPDNYNYQGIVTQVGKFNNYCSGSYSNKTRCGTSSYWQSDVNVARGTDYSLNCYTSDCNPATGNCCQTTSVNTLCELNTMVNFTYTDCSSEPIRSEINCASMTNYYTGEPKNCATRAYTWGNSTGCFDQLCTPGEMIYQCGRSYNYRYSCNTDGFGWGSSSRIYSCPTNTTCQNFAGQTSGLCG